MSLGLGCNEAEFGGSTSNNAPAGDPDKPCDASTAPCEKPLVDVVDAQPPPATPPATPTSCVKGDKAEFAWSGLVADCLITEGRTWNFELKKCAAMRKSKFACDWPNVTKELSDRGLLTPVLKGDSENGSKLVSCGQTEDGNRIVVQWVKLPKDGLDCGQPTGGATITTGCYTLYNPGETRPPPPANEAERAQQVYACMDKL